MKNYRRIRFITNEYDKSKKLVDKAAIIIKEANLSLKIVEDDSADVIIPVGGDNVFLKACRESNFDSNLVYAGINTGSIGFLQSIEEKFLNEFLICLDSGLENYRLLPFLDITFKFEDGDRKYKAINEIEIAGLYNKVLDFKQYVNGSLFHKVRASGIIISSANGSTAMNKSYGGPILFFDEAIVSTLRGAADNPSKMPYMRPSLVMKSTKIEFPSLIEERSKNPKFNRFRNEVYFSIDGVIIKDVDTNKLESVEVKVSDERIKVINLSNGSRVDIIRNKLL